MLIRLVNRLVIDLSISLTEFFGNCGGAWFALGFLNLSKVRTVMYESELKDGYPLG